MAWLDWTLDITARRRLREGARPVEGSLRRCRGEIHNLVFGPGRQLVGAAVPATSSTRWVPLLCDPEPEHSGASACGTYGHVICAAGVRPAVRTRLGALGAVVLRYLDAANTGIAAAAARAGCCHPGIMFCNVTSADPGGGNGRVAGSYERPGSAASWA